MAMFHYFFIFVPEIVHFQQISKRILFVCQRSSREPKTRADFKEFEEQSHYDSDSSLVSAILS